MRDKLQGKISGKLCKITKCKDLGYVWRRISPCKKHSNKGNAKKSSDIAQKLL